MAVFSLIGSVVASAASAVGGAVSALSGAGLAGLSAAAGVIGTGIQMMGASKAAKGAARAEALRERQMNLQAARERRQTIRQSIVARAQALSAGTAQGATGSSGLLGGMGQVTSQAASNIQGTNQGQEIGQQMFAANRQIASGQTMQSIGAGFQTLGSQLQSGFESFRRVF